jgi:hypothetical protein
VPTGWGEANPDVIRTLRGAAAADHVIARAAKIPTTIESRRRMDLFMGRILPPVIFRNLGFLLEPRSECREGD